MQKCIAMAFADKCEGCTHTTAMTALHTEPGDRRQPQLQCWSFPSTQPLLGITQHLGVLLPVKNSKCLFSVRKVRFLTGVFLKTRSSARLNYFGALCHPKHVLGGSQSLPQSLPIPGCAVASDPSLGAQSSSVCGPKGKRLQSTKQNHRIVIFHVALELLL